MSGEKCICKMNSVLPGQENQTPLNRMGLGASGLNGNQLKLIAVISMLIDHTAFLLLGYGLLPAISADAYRYHIWRLIYYGMRCIGRLAFPIYAFLLVEGFLHTRDWRKYALRLGIFAAISEIPFDLMVFPRRFVSLCDWKFLWEMQNVFFTLLIGLLTIKSLDLVNRKTNRNQSLTFFLCLGILGAGSFLAWMLKADYDLVGVVLIALFYQFRQDRVKQCIMGFIWFFSTLGSGRYFLGMAAAFLLIFCYNGKQGENRGKYRYYLFYPAHMLLLYGIFRIIFLAF